MAIDRTANHLSELAMSKKIRFSVHRLCLICTILFSTVGCDQASKFVARDTVRITGPLSYLNDLVRLEYARNPGAFLSMGAQLPHAVRFWVFNVAVAIFLTCLAFVLFKGRETTPVKLIGLSLILGGGVGNLVDRIAFGSVTDFLIVGFGSLTTGIFNFADVAIVIGVSLLALNQATHRAKNVPLR